LKKAGFSRPYPAAQIR